MLAGRPNIAAGVPAPGPASRNRRYLEKCRFKHVLKTIPLFGAKQMKVVGENWACAYAVQVQFSARYLIFCGRTCSVLWSSIIEGTLSLLRRLTLSRALKYASRSI